MTWYVFASVNFHKKKLKKEYKTIESMSLCSLNNWTVILYFPVAILLHKVWSQFYIRFLIGFTAVLHFYAKLYFNVRELQLENWKIFARFFHIFITAMWIFMFDLNQAFENTQQFVESMFPKICSNCKWIWFWR